MGCERQWPNEHPDPNKKQTFWNLHCKSENYERGKQQKNNRKLNTIPILEVVPKDKNPFAIVCEWVFLWSLKYYLPLVEASRLRSIVCPGRDHFGFSPNGANWESTASTVWG